MLLASIGLTAAVTMIAGLMPVLWGVRHAAGGLLDEEDTKLIGKLVNAFDADAFHDDEQRPEIDELS